MNQYDEIKSLLKISRMLVEQSAPVNIDADIEQDINVETIKLHGKNKQDLELSTDEKTAFQNTMDEFVNEVSDLSDFGVLNVYPNNVEWSGKVIDFDLEFFLSIGETQGVYINGDMIKIDDDLLELINKLNGFYEKFKSRWAKIISQRKKTDYSEDEPGL